MRRHGGDRPGAGGQRGAGRAARFTLPGDVSASDRFYEQDITEPFVLDDGRIAVPTGPGLGVSPIGPVLESYTVSTEWIQA